MEVDGTVFPFSEKTKYLGVELDHRLLFNDHIINKLDTEAFKISDIFIDYFKWQSETRNTIQDGAMAANHQKLEAL